MEMARYYELRKAIRKLYDNHINNGDLCSRILEVRDKYRAVTSINIEIESYSIAIMFNDNTSNDKKEQIKQDVLDRISYHLSDNINNIDIEDKIELSRFISSRNFCDIFMLGNMLKINL
jgi:hypothetical protein